MALVVGWVHPRLHSIREKNLPSGDGGGNASSSPELWTAAYILL